LEIIGAFSPAGRGFFTFSVLIIRTGRLAPAFLLIRASILRSGNAIGLMPPYCSTFAALVLVFYTVLGFFGAIIADLVIIYGSAVIGFFLFRTF